MTDPATSALTAQWRQRNTEQLTQLKRRFSGGLPAEEVLRERSQQVDNLLGDLWITQALPSTAALVAVGGYGRGELFPGSDVDLLILLSTPADESIATQLERLVALFWDAGLEVGHSVRTIDECLTEAKNDISIQTALIESRLVAGDEGLYFRFLEAFLAALDPKSFYRAKTAEQDERYRKHNETPYSLEPNCKESPGGLRDLQMIVWLAKACGCGGAWDDLLTHGIVTQQERDNLRQSESFLQNLRLRLHFHTGRREDRLIFDVQNALAEQMNYHAKDDRRASERMMQAYYKNAKSVTQLNSLILQNIRLLVDKDEPSLLPDVIDDAFQIRDRLLDLRHPSIFADQPSRLLQAFRLIQNHDLRGMTAPLLRALYGHRHLIDDAFRIDPENQRNFLAMLQSDNGLIQEFRRMNQWGILGRYLPAFSRIVGQMQHDLFHVYTVDQHILQVMRNVRRFTMVEHAHEYPYESRLINEFERPWILYVAALFHDIAKGRGGDHSILGMADAQQFCADHGVEDADSKLIVWLVKEHLTMSQIAQKEDITDPDVVRNFATRVGDERHLNALYLLTVADIRGTSPKVWNGWKSQLLISLHQNTQHLLRAGSAPEIHGAIAERQRGAMRLLRYFALTDSVQDRLWKHLDTVYFIRHSADEIAWHTRALHYRLNPPQPIVKARLHRPDLHDGDSDDHAPMPTHAMDGFGIQVMVYTQDQTDLFLRMVGFFAKAGFSIADAKIHTTRHGYALDSFVLLDVQNRDSERDLIAYIEYELTQRLLNPTSSDAPPSGRLSREVKHFPIKPVVQMWPDDRGDKYLLSVITADRPGLLYTIANILTRHHINLETAKIATLGERVEDVFLMSGGDLGQSSKRLELEAELINALTL